MFSKRVCQIVSLSLLVLFVSGCAGRSKSAEISDPCSKAPKWYDKRKCPKGYLCGFGMAKSGDMMTAELKAQGFSRANLQSNLEQAVAVQMKGGLNEMEGAEDLEQDVLSTFFRFAVQGLVTNAVVHDQESESCGGKNWYWVVTKKDLDGVDWNAQFKKAASEANLPEATQKFIEEIDDWSERVERELGY